MKWLLLATLVLSACREKPNEVRVAAASDLSEAFEELGKKFEAETKMKVSFTFGSSGLLAKQLSEGAPFDLFASASERFIDETVKAGACDGATSAHFARGRLALYGLTPPSSLDVLTADTTKKIALANPEHAPYGKAAREALERAQLLEKVQSKLVLSENVRQALQFAKTGNAQFAFVAWANVPESERTTNALLIEAQLHAPIDQSIAVCLRGKNADGAKQFAAFLKREESSVTLARFGFEP
ncbi:MAG: molybdate ABC transporter substrate-binding protein [Archangium sp.]|nr:molybdate ABC transporter substrate-binding protein [Archangium sp.]